MKTLYNNLCYFKRTASLFVGFSAYALFILISMPNVSAQEPAQEPAPFKLVVLGDSLTAGRGVTLDDNFPSQLQRALRREGMNVVVINAGVSGDTSAGGLARFEWSVPSDARAIIIALGGNDLLRGLSPAQLKNNLDAIIVKSKARGLKILLAGMRAPLNLGKNYVTAFDAAYPQLAAKHGVAIMPFFLKNVAGVPALNQSDVSHPNPDGVALMVRNILPHLRTLLPPIAGGD